PLLPSLTLSPGSTSKHVPRGNRTQISVTVTNTGRAATGILTVDVPSHPFLQLKTPTTLSSLLPSNSTSFTIQIFPPSDSPFGSLTGYVSIFSSIISSKWNFNFQIVSLVTNT